MLSSSIPPRTRRASLIALFLGVALIGTGCHGAPAPDAYGNFEANEVSVSSQAS